MNKAALRWGQDDAPEDGSEARARLLDAAETCFAQFGPAKTTIEDIARAASVSRATVYRYFDGGRDELVLGVILRDAERYLTKVKNRIDKQPTLADAIVDFVEHSVRTAQRDPSLSRLLSVEDARIAGGVLAGQSVALFEKITEFFRPMFLRWADEVRPGVELEDASEWILRAVLSLVSVSGPRRRSAEVTQSYLRAFLLPGIIRSPL